MATNENGFQPDYGIPPGEILAEMLAARGIGKGEFASRCGCPPKTISGILNGHVAITPQTALEFGRVLGTAASLWSNLEARYRLRLAEQNGRQFDGARRNSAPDPIHSGIPRSNACRQ
ncbi:MAG: HigA family addiction module antidote protein [Cellvibrionales bacterium]|nr:HigA family addiction module antidote protein [Cellvibrionales bacterium]